MSKIEVLATSFILTLTVISTAPLQSADLQWSFDYFRDREQQIEKERFSYFESKTSVSQYQKFITRETYTFSFSHAIDNISQKIKKESWYLPESHWQKALLVNNNFNSANNAIRLVSDKTLEQSSLNFVKAPLYRKFTHQIILQETNFQLLSKKIWDRQKINSWIGEQKTWTANFKNIKTLKNQSPIKISTEGLPIISLIIASFFCLLFSKSPKAF